MYSKSKAVASNVVAFPKAKAPTTAKGIAATAPEASHDYKHDCEALSAAALKKKYPLTYNTWRGTTHRAEKFEVLLDPRFEKFPDFLHHMGPRPAKDITLDRIDHKGPYTVENCRWADKKTQSQNRSNAVKITCDGQTLTIEECAARLQRSISWVYKKKKLGWSDEEIVKGKAASAKKLSTFPWPAYKPGLRETWETGYQKEAKWLDTVYGLRRESRLSFYRWKSKSVLMSIKSMLEKYECEDPPADLVAKYEQAQRNFYDACEKVEREIHRKKTGADRHSADPFA